MLLHLDLSGPSIQFTQRDPVSQTASAAGSCSDAVGSSRGSSTGLCPQQDSNYVQPQHPRGR